MRYRSLFALGLAVGVVFVSATAAQHEDNDAAIYRLTELKWQDGPDALPKGAKIAILEGNPSKPGPFVFRVKVPDGYRVPPHTHPSPERITVISGTFYLGMGKTFDETKGKPMPAGTYGQWPAGMTHYVWTKGETVLQFHGTGPWTIRYLNPADDPRASAKR
jgi:quercetin dioxygenase-like cupin family protein